VVGNCFALEHEHETAIKFFRRATQLDPTSAYAHTLAAHEFMSHEDIDSALEYYRTAVRLDPRHYNAWYIRIPAAVVEIPK